MPVGRIPSPTRAVARGLRSGARKLRPLFERRLSGRRIKADAHIRCNLGMVIDVSTGGMCLRTRHRLRGVVTLEIQVLSRDAKVKAEVCWTKRQGFHRYLNGVRFMDMRPLDAAELFGLDLDDELEV